VAPIERENERLRAENERLRAKDLQQSETITRLERIVSTLESALEAQRAALTDQTAAFQKVLGELQSLQKRFLGPKSERMPTPKEELRKKRGKKADPALVAEKRKRNAERKAEVRTETILHRVPDEKRSCPKCGRTAAKTIGNGRITKTWEYVPGYFVGQEHHQEKIACTCGEYVVMADPPAKPFENGRYGPHFIAHVIVAKCLDAIPLHRMEKQFARLGIPMSRSTMTDLFHRAAEELAPLVTALLAMVAAADVVLADETSIKIQDREKRGFIWTFIADNLIAYRFSVDVAAIRPRTCSVAPRACSSSTATRDTAR
jgi:transposase